MCDHKRLRAFQLADEVVIGIYRLTKVFPKDELFGLKSQMRKAAVSVPLNIVEGCARESQNEYLRFLEIAFGSLRELHYQFELSKKLGYIINRDIKPIQEKIIEAEKVLSALLRSMRKSNKSHQ